MENQIGGLRMKIPEYTKENIDQYALHRIPTGDFLYAVLTNDLFGAMGRADDKNREAIFAICTYIYNNIPSNCWGSKEKVELWLKTPSDVEFEQRQYDTQ